MTDFEKFKEELPGKGKSHSLLTDRTIVDKELEHVINVWKKNKINENHERSSQIVFKVLLCFISFCV